MSEFTPIPLETTIDRVVVYLDGARVYRSGKIDLKKGFQQVRIIGLTKNLLKDSVRISGKGKGSLGAIDIKTVYQEQVPHEKLNELLLEEQKLLKELQLLKQKFDFTNQQNEQMLTLGRNFSTEFSKWLAAGETTLTTLTEFIDFQNKRNSDYLKERQRLEEEIEKLNKKLATLQASINEYRNKSRVEQTYEVVLAVDALQAGPFAFELSYQTVGVNWIPSYDVDIKSDKAVLKGLAQITNRTLEDWSDINLEISTAVFKPLKVIEPNPFYINIYEPLPPPGARPAAAKRMMRAEVYPSVAGAPVADEKAKYAEEVMVEPTAELKESPAGIQSYSLSGKWTIPSDGNIHPVTLTTYELTTEKEFYWNAINSLGVIAQDKIINGDAVILAGNAKVYSEGEFIGETLINQISPKEEFKLGAREEPKLKAEKKLLERVKEKAGITKGKRSIYYEYELKIKNYRKQPSKLTIKDVIPYSRSERIKVKNFSGSIAPTNENLGIYTWELSLKVDEELKIKYQYEVEWERDFEITPSLP